MRTTHSRASNNLVGKNPIGLELFPMAWETIPILLDTVSGMLLLNGRFQQVQILIYQSSGPRCWRSLLSPGKSTDAYFKVWREGWRQELSRLCSVEKNGIFVEFPHSLLRRASPIQRSKPFPLNEAVWSLVEDSISKDRKEGCWRKRNKA